QSFPRTGFSRAVEDLLARSQCFDPSVTTMSVAAGSCNLTSDRLALLQLASLTTLTDSAAGSAASTGSTMVSPCWSRKSVGSPHHSLRFAITGSPSGITRASNCPKVRWTCAELSFIAHFFFRFAQRRRHAISRVAGLPPRGGQEIPKLFAYTAK